MLMTPAQDKVLGEAEVPLVSEPHLTGLLRGFEAGITEDLRHILSQCC